MFISNIVDPDRKRKTPSFPNWSALTQHNFKLGLKRFLRGYGIERSFELPLCADVLELLIRPEVTLLDIGSGESIWPSYVAAKYGISVTCIDSYDSVLRQYEYGATLSLQKPMEVIIDDFVLHDFKGQQFDYISIVSVLEHVKDNGDTLMIKKAASLLKSGGYLLITVPYNEGGFREFWLKFQTYAEHKDAGGQYFYQRHYDMRSALERLVMPSGLNLCQKIFFGEKGLRIAEFLFCGPKWRRWMKAFYLWSSPYMGRILLEILADPPSVPGLQNYTVNGCFLLLTKGKQA